MASNLSVESPNFEKINSEAGQFTSDAVAVLWAAINDTRAAQRRDHRRATEKLAPKILSLTPAATVSDLDSGGASTISFTSGTQSFTGVRAPETGEARVLFVHNSGAGTITVVNNATSETANRFYTATGANVSLTTGKGMVFQYLASGWREVARSG